VNKFRGCLQIHEKFEFLVLKFRVFWIYFNLFIYLILNLMQFDIDK
jgi:hypothetical protein